MCQNGKCCCLDVETGALIFAIPNLLITALGTATCIGFLIYTNIAVGMAVNRMDESWTQAVWADQQKEDVVAGALVFGMAANYVLSIGLVVNVIALAFAICLIVGICKRNPNHVKAYFISGVMLMCLWGIFVLVSFFGLDVIGGLLNLIAFTIYGLILHMIRMTYVKFQGETTYTQFSNQLAVIEKF